MSDTITKTDIHALEGLLKPHKEMECVGDCMQSKALVKLIKLAKAYQSAESVLGEKKVVCETGDRNCMYRECIDSCFYYEEKFNNIGFNQMHDIATPIVAKLKAEIKEMYTYSQQDNANLIEKITIKNDAIGKLQARVGELEAYNKIASKAVDIKQRIELTIKNTKLQAEIEELKGKDTMSSIAFRKLEQRFDGLPDQWERFIKVIRQEVIGDK